MRFCFFNGRGDFSEKRPIKPRVLVGFSVSCLLACFWDTPSTVENGLLKKGREEVVFVTL